MFRLPIICGLSLSSSGFCCVCPSAGDAISASGAKTKVTRCKNPVFNVLLLCFDQDCRLIFFLLFHNRQAILRRSYENLIALKTSRSGIKNKDVPRRAEASRVLQFSATTFKSTEENSLSVGQPEA